MVLNHQHILPESFADTARVWIYQSNRPFTETETSLVTQQLTAFAQSWLSHGDTVKGFATVVYNQFIVIMADETDTGVSGCSTDGSVRLVKSIEQQFQVDLFNRQQLAFIINDTIELLPLSQLNDAVQEGHINADTLYFNNTVLTKKEWLEGWLVPVKESWLQKKVELVG